MKTILGAMILVLLVSPAISYFKYERPLQPATTAGQHYVVIDEAIWEHALPNLQDLRLYSGDRELAFSLMVEAGNTEVYQNALRILQPGTVSGKTRFLLDLSDVSEYDRVKLTLATRNFIAHARVEGQDDPHGSQWVALGTTTLYDLSDEKLGHNSTLQIPLSAFKYLRVTTDSSIKPLDVQGASSATTRTDSVVWRDVVSQAMAAQNGRETTFAFTVPRNTPVERVTFEIAPQQPNFRRSVQVYGENNLPSSAGEISRIHLQRNGQKIDSELTAVTIHHSGPGSFHVSVLNGDDVPLKITNAKLQQLERRIYFDEDAGAQVQLYYGDPKLEFPVYDYRKLFQKDANATRLELNPEVLNAGYTGRPDDRPWSERHPSVLWAAIIAAVGVLGALAYRSLNTPAR